MSAKIPLQQVPDDAVKHHDPFLPISRKKPQPRFVIGFFQHIRLISMYAVLALFVGLPWLRWDGRQALWFNIPERQFFVFGATFAPQDFFMLSWIFIMAALTLFVVTVFGGRVFCGYACPQTVWTHLFMQVEKWFQGDRNARLKLDKQPLSFNKVWRKGATHAVWLLLAFITAASFVSYFASTDSMYTAWTQLQLGGLSVPVPDWNSSMLVFLTIFTLATYGNAGWMREQFCIQVCPYGRFQSVMFDRDTLIVSYDFNRGEPRGSRKKGTHPADKGDCIDCDLCVHVCPTGIDIRNGLQMACIQCAACIDACDSVMDKMNYPRGLVRYTTERELIDHEKTHWLRPRVLGYTAFLLALFALFAFTLYKRVPIQFEAIRDRNQLYSIQTDGSVENDYLLKISNKTQQEQTYALTLAAPKGLRLENRQKQIFLDPGEVYQVPVAVIGQPGQFKAGETPIQFTVTGLDDPSLTATVDNVFRAPTSAELRKLQKAESGDD